MNVSSGNKNIIYSDLINKSILNVIQSNIDYNCYSSPKGLRELRIKISEFLSDCKRLESSYENMLITNGSQQSLS